MRLFSNVAQDTVLTADPGSGGTTISVVGFTGWPSPSSQDTGLACLDFGTAGVELVEYTGITGTALTGCTRGVDGTTAQAHNVGATVRHVASASDLQAFMRHGEVTVAAFQAASWYGSPGITTFTTGSIASGTIKAVQFPIPVRTRFLKIGAEVTTVGAGNLRFAIYADNGAGRPAGLLVDCGTVSGNTLGHREVAIDAYLSRRLLHLAIMAEGATISVRCASAQSPPLRLPFTTAGTTVYTGYQQAGVTTGAAPSSFPSGMVPNSGMSHIIIQTA